MTASAAVAGSSRISRAASSSAASIAVPHDSPARIPSSRVIRRAIANASRSRDADPAVDHRRVVGAREEVLADALGEVRPGRVAGQHAALRVGADDPQRRVLRLEVAGDAGDRAAGADRRDEVRDPALGLRPDLGAGRPLVGVGVRLVPVLVGLERARDVAGEPRRDRVVALGRLGGDVGRAQDDLGAVRAQQRLLLRRLLVRHDEDAAVALERGRDREPVAGVARRRLDDRAAGLEQARPLGGLDHRQADPVLDRAARVEHLELGEEQRLAVRRARGRASGARCGRAACRPRGRGSSRRSASAARIPCGRSLPEQGRQAEATLAATGRGLGGAVGGRDGVRRERVERRRRTMGGVALGAAARARAPGRRDRGRRARRRSSAAGSGRRSGGPGTARGCRR